MSGPHPMTVSFLDDDPAPHVKVLIALNTVVWPHTTDPRDSGAAECVTVDPGAGMLPMQLNLPTSGPAGVTVLYTTATPKTVWVYASTDREDAASTVIADTVFTKTITPGQLSGPELPVSPRIQSRPDRPHFGWPFTRGETGGVRTVEQASDDHVYGQQYALVVTPLGWRPERPEYGWPWPEFSMVPLDLEPLRLALRRFVPDVDVVVSEWADVASQAIRHVRFDDPNPNRMS